MAIDEHAKVRYAAWDIEIAQEIPDGVDDWMTLRPLGISCAAIHKAILKPDDDGLVVEYEAARVYHGDEQSDGRYADRMTPRQCSKVAYHLIALEALGYTVVSYNGLGFDFDVLAEECNDRDMYYGLRYLTKKHVDIAFAFFAEKGYMPSLANACKGMGIEGKAEGMSGAKAPEMWAGDIEQQQRVLEYVLQDARITGRLYETVIERQRLRWITRSGKARAWRPTHWGVTPDGSRRLATVSEALELPEPDTSWMTDPWPRTKFSAWLEG
jgi:hypothetical protein